MPGGTSRVPACSQKNRLRRLVVGCLCASSSYCGVCLRHTGCGTVVIHAALLHTNFTAIFAGTNFSTRTVSSTEWFLASVMNSERSNRRKSFQSECRSVTTFSAQEESRVIPTSAVILAFRKKIVSFQHLLIFSTQKKSFVLTWRRF